MDIIESHPLVTKVPRQWSEPAQCFNEQWVLYIANLMHGDSRVVIKVVRFGLTIACFPDEHAAELVER